MKNRLSVRILVFFTVLMVLQAGAVTFFVYQSIQNLFTGNIERSDRRMAKDIAQLLTVAREETGSWVFMSETLGIAIMRGMGISRPFGGMHWNETPAVLLDGQGKVLFSNVYAEGFTVKDYMRSAVKIGIGGKTEAYLLVGSMLDLSLDSAERLFLNNILAILSLAGLGGIIIWIIFGWIFLSKAFAPLVDLSSAMKSVQSGAYGRTLPVVTEDEVGSLTQKFNEMTSALKEDQEYKKRLIADTAHELRTPLSVIQASLEMIIDGHYQADEARMKGLYDEVIRFSALVQRMHDLAVIDGKESEDDAGGCDAGLVISQSCELFSAHALAAEIELAVGPFASGYRVETGESSLKQISANLLSNAFRAVEGREGARVAVTLDESDGKLVWNVDDNGPGIPAQDRHKVFERFYRVDEARSRDTGGSGLGLAIVSTLVEKARGTAEVLDSPLGGARLRITLPLKDGPHAGDGS
jgi:two-component system sensor histidine kinase BaeS